MRKSSQPAVDKSGLLCEWYKLLLPVFLFVMLTFANDAESPVVCDDVVDVAIEQFDPIEPVGVGVVIVVAISDAEQSKKYKKIQ